ncbi:hypothetical protein BC939DRAFT_246783 [Gamsiella multidivaricata]|uniref:uncharacterized protein n=1 Tax=Gamsiella multidivaricata TaxID=101098 RepID=UPI00221EF884|nr:uncharacterized protein BC939DRAFT_246783 [Gamsiella multidivaricata]KAI7819961.1 hypothetical protein BC939DRAFT_246783 [Gamsiella multidivaricata]
MNDQRPMHIPMPQRPQYGGPEGPAPGARYPGAHPNQHPLRAIPMHLQRPPFEQPMPNHPKAPNPLEDLIDTEKEYVADLKVLLQRVSAGWTQDDFPPKEVDVLLRNIEDIYAVNRKFSKKLNDVHASGDVMKELGSVLMWFVDSMETSYSNFCRNHVPHFDNWPEIMNNSRLQDILAEIAAEQVQHVTLDTFLMKPIDRLHYYRRLYMRLLDSSERGKPDFDALEAAFMRIDTILRFVTVDVPGTSRHPASPALSAISGISAMRNALPSPPITDQNQTSPRFLAQGRLNNNTSPALPPSPMSPSHRPQQSPARTAEAMQELERSLDTSQVLDLFTMEPKTCALSLALIERDVHIRGDLAFTIANEDGVVERYDDGHIILLSDLLLMCRVKTPEEIEQNPEGDESSIWLLFPPLAIRHVVARDGTIDEGDHIVELTIVNRVTARIWTQDEQLKFNWMDEVADAQQKDAAKVAQQQQQQQQQSQQLNRNATQSHPMRPMGSPLSPTFHGDPRQRPFNNGPMSPTFQGHHGGPMSPRPQPPMLAMGGPGPMNGMPSPGYPPQMSPGGGMGRPMMNPGGQMNQRPPRPPANHRMSMRRTNTVTARPGPPRRLPTLGEVAAPQEVMFKTRPCDVFQWRDDIWDPLVENDDCYAELRLTTANRLAMAVTTYEGGQLVLNAWIVESTTFRRASETDVSISMDMGASVQWFLVALNSIKEADDFCMAFQRAKDRAMYDPSLQKSNLPVLSRGQSLASTPTRQPQPREMPVKQTLTSMHPPAECKLLLQAGDHGQWMSLGAARVEIKMEKPSGYVRLFVGLVSNQKRILDSVIVQCDCLELVGTKKLAITLMNPQEKMSIIYMLQFKDEIMATKIYEGLSLNQNE